MCGAYVGALPEEVMLILEDGDLILVGNFGWWISWLIMYLTNSQISHIAVYVGDGKILHATVGGAEIALRCLQRGSEFETVRGRESLTTHLDHLIYPSEQSSKKESPELECQETRQERGSRARSPRVRI
jgi:cell wall-associated NlpC family hydrolase